MILFGATQMYFSFERTNYRVLPKFFPFDRWPATFTTPPIDATPTAAVTSAAVVKTPGMDIIAAPIVVWGLSGRGGH